MMTDLIFGGIIIVLLGAIGWIIRENSIERSKLINAILAKNSQEYVTRTLAENTKIEPEINPPSDLTPESQLSQEDWEKSIEDNA